MNKKELFLLSLGIFLTAMAWLIADVHHSATQEKVRVKMEIPTLKKYEIKKSILDVLKAKSE